MPLPDGSRVRVKVCGLTEPVEARAVADLGVDWIGLNLHPASKRFVSEERAAAIVAALPDRGAAVALFVDRPVGEMLSVVDRLGITVVQLHGEEPVGTVRTLRGRDLTVVRAFRLGSLDDVVRMRRWLAEARAGGAAPDAILLDARVTGQVGGTGRAIADEWLEAVWDEPLDVPLILAGGLTPANVAESVRRWRPWMVDVASGVESSPGRKDPRRVLEFIEAVGRVDREVTRGPG